MALQIRQLTPGDGETLAALMVLFGEAFEDEATYTARPPRLAYLRGLLSRDFFIALVASTDDTLVGGIIAYELPKCEQERSEIYLYDLAVASTHRRQGIATALIQFLMTLGAARGAEVIFVQADTAPEDEPALALYAQFTEPHEVVHFDISTGL